MTDDDLIAILTEDNQELEAELDLAVEAIAQLLSLITWQKGVTAKQGTVNAVLALRVEQIEESYGLAMDDLTRYTRAVVES